MTLDDYLRMPGASAAKLAAAAGCSPTTITRARAGLQLPRPKVVRAIYVATKGAVGPADFYDLPSLTFGEGNRAAARAAAR